MSAGSDLVCRTLTDKSELRGWLELTGRLYAEGMQTLPSFGS